LRVCIGLSWIGLSWIGLARIGLARAVGPERIALPDQSGKLGQRVGRRPGITRVAAIIRIVPVAARVRVIRHQLP
jgi:hypothetical protein